MREDLLMEEEEAQKYEKQKQGIIKFNDPLHV